MRILPALFPHQCSQIPVSLTKNSRFSYKGKCWTNVRKSGTISANATSRKGRNAENSRFFSLSTGICRCADRFVRTASATRKSAQARVDAVFLGSCEPRVHRARLAYSYLLESLAFGPFENCRETIDTAFKLGREAEEAKNKSRFEIYQTRRLMAHAYAWHGEEFDRAIDDAEATVEMAPYDAADRAQFAFYLANAGQFDKALDWVSWAIAHNYQDFFATRANTAWTYYLAGRYEDALQVLKGVEATHPWPTSGHLCPFGPHRGRESRRRRISQDRTPFGPRRSLQPDPRADEAKISRRPAQSRSAGASGTR